MFEAIRSRLIGAWRAIRERGLVTLFFFELLVVTLGVLLAQGVAEWAGDQSEMASNLELGDAAAVAKLWQGLGPCLVQDTDDILRSSASGSAIDPSLLDRPITFTNTVMPLTEQTKLLVRERYGEKIAYEYDRMERLTSRLDTNVLAMVGLWGRLARLDPQLGGADEKDRESARETAVAIRAYLGTIETYAHGIYQLAERMELEPKILGESPRFARNCGEFRAFGRRFVKDGGTDAN